MPVPLFASSLEPYMERITTRLADVAASGRYILGPEVDAFEEEFARYLGVRHCVGVANGTDALTLALRAVGVRPGDDVVVPSFTFYATAEAVVNAGARPVFCDVDPDTFCVTADTVRAALTPRTTAAVPVHLFGNVAPVPEIAALGVPVVEDAAQAHGATLGGRKAGSLGAAATFSFYPSKNLPCLGDGGAVATDDDELAERVRRLRFHGSRDKVTYEEVGVNSRLDELQAAVLRVLLPELDGWNEARRAAARAYEEAGLTEALPELRPPRPSAGAGHVYHLYVASHPRASTLTEPLSAQGIGARTYYRRPVHEQPGMAPYVERAPELPGTAEAASTNLALPMGNRLGRERIAEVVAACRLVPETALD